MPRLSNEQHEAFCHAYVGPAQYHAGKAAALVGYSTSSNVPANLMARADVAARIAELNMGRMTAADITAQRVMLELGRVAFSDVRKVFDEHGNLLPTSELDDDTAACVSGIEIERRRVPNGYEIDLATGKRVRKYDDVETVKVKRYDKNPALGILAKHFKLVGDEGDGVNALASALAERLKTARARRVAHEPEIIEEVRP